MLTSTKHPVFINHISFSGSYGNYWSRSLHTGYSDYARGLYFLSVNIYTYYYYRYYGQCVRPVCTQN